MKLMLKIHDEVASVEEQENSNKKVSAFDLILKEVVLAQCLKNVISQILNIYLIIFDMHPTSLYHVYILHFRYTMISALLA